MSASTVREAVGVFDDPDSLQKAADALLQAGFTRAQLSILGSHDAVVRKLGRMYGDVSEIEDNPRAPMMGYASTSSVNEAKAALVGIPAFVAAIAALGPTVAADLPLSTSISWTIGGAIIGALGGLVCAKALNARRTNYFRDQVDRGGILLWVRTATPEDESKACDVLRKASARDVHVHDRPVIEEFGFVYGYLDRLAGDPKPPAA